jgi:hypothetical protein
VKGGKPLKGENIPEVLVQYGWVGFHMEYYFLPTFPG